MPKTKVYRKQTDDASLRRMFSTVVPSEQVLRKEMNKSIRNRCVKAEGLSEP